MDNGRAASVDIKFSDFSSDATRGDDGVPGGSSVFKRTFKFQFFEVNFLVVIEDNRVLVLVGIGKESVVRLAVSEVCLFEAQAGNDVVLENESKGDNVVE